MKNFTQKEEDHFDAIYPSFIREISSIHWTPTQVIKQAVNWLVSKNAHHVLDIGSGVGKFCIYGGSISTLHFTGVEIRANLLEISKKAAAKLTSGQTQFIKGNITEIEFDTYDAAYFYHPFCEQEAISDKIDDSIPIGPEILSAYEGHVLAQLAKARPGFLFITYRSPDFQPPSSFIAQEIMQNGDLVFWEKRNEKDI